METRATRRFASALLCIARLRFFARAASVALLPVLTGCLFETSTPDPLTAHTLAYRLEAGPGHACRISVRIDAWPPGAPKLFQAPVYYADNPVLPVPGLRASDLDVRDASGRKLAARDSVSGTPADGNLILLPEAARVFSYAVDLAPSDPDRFGLPAPGLAPGVDAIDGAYFFVLPVVEEGVAARWRAPMRLSLDIAAPGRSLVGSDPHRDLDDPYELMFLRAVLDPLRMLTVPIRGHQLTFYAASDSAFDMPLLSEIFANCLGAVEDSLMPLTVSNYFLGEFPTFSGIEGIQGYWFKADGYQLPQVHTHELIHTFVGIYHGDLEDPWWKEGMTNYLGLLLPLQVGFINDSIFAATALADLGGKAAVRDLPLSSPAIRTRLFLPLDSAWTDPQDPLGFPDLVYGKGAQASMILDRWILEHSGGRKSVYDLVRALVRLPTPGFTRSQFVAATESVAGAPAESFLASLLDQPGAFPPDSLRATYLALRAMGRFGPGGGKSPVPGIEPPAAKRGPPTVTGTLPLGVKL
ncbi:MAG: hypothetical protein JF616_17855 [Fibrobacteres bacterium]|nr:hypothetical protein [Fibrobacterota bacterium]